jgi:predicted nucleic acid-binding protein
MLLIADTTVISNFAFANRLDILVSQGFICITEDVLNELETAKKRGVLLIDFSHLCIEVLRLNEDEKDTFIRLNSKFGRGEASCLTIALHRSAGILTDDLDARRFAQRGGISVSGSIGILVKAIESGKISREQGNDLLRIMIVNGFYSPVETLDQFLTF